jgi:hypothetical protein
MKPTAPKKTHNRKALLAVSAVTYLALALAFGVHAAFTLVALAAVVALWAVACRRFPVVGALTYRFFLGFFGGLTGCRGGYYGYGYGARRYRRRDHQPRMTTMNRSLTTPDKGNTTLNQGRNGSAALPSPRKGVA